MSKTEHVTEADAPKTIDKLFGSLTLGVVFRHFLSGAIFVASFLYSRGSLQNSEDITFLKDHSSIVVVWSLICGAIIYALHRSATNPVFEFLRHRIFAEKCEWFRNFVMPKLVHEMMLKRWEFTHSIKARASHIYEWGDYIHLLYTADLGVALGSASAYRLATNKADWQWNTELILLGVIFLFTGFYTDCRKHVVEQNLYEDTSPALQRRSFGFRHRT